MQSGLFRAVAGTAAGLALAMAAASSPLAAQQTLEQRSVSVDKRSQEKRPKSIRSTADAGRIGVSPNRVGEVPERCEDAGALAAQIASGGPVDRMVRTPTLGSLDASRGLEAPPFEPRMQPRHPAVVQGMKEGRLRGVNSEIGRSMRSMQQPNREMKKYPDC